MPAGGGGPFYVSDRLLERHALRAHTAPSSSGSGGSVEGGRVKCVTAAAEEMSVAFSVLRHKYKYTNIQIQVIQVVFVSTDALTSSGLQTYSIIILSWELFW